MIKSSFFTIGDDLCVQNTFGFNNSCACTRNLVAYFNWSIYWTVANHYPDYPDRCSWRMAGKISRTGSIEKCPAKNELWADAWRCDH